MHPSYIPEYPGSKFLIELAHSNSVFNDRQTFADHLQPARQTEWVVYAKPPLEVDPISWTADRRR